MNRKQKAEGRKQTEGTVVVCLLPSAFCLLPTASCSCLLAYSPRSRILIQPEAKKESREDKRG